VTQPQAEIVVVNDYAWKGNRPGLGALGVSIDRHRAGVAPTEGALRVPVTPGPHRVRVRLWHYYGSRPRTVEVLAGSRTVLRADRPHGRAAALILFRPFKSLSLEVDSTVPADEASKWKDDPADKIRRQRFQRVALAINVAIFVVILVVARLIL
jgi:hypothetical protein